GRVLAGGCGWAWPLSAQDAVEMEGDVRGSGRDALSGGQDDRAGLGTRIAAGPGRRVGQRMPSGNAVPGTDDERHGVSLSAADSGTSGGGCSRGVFDQVVTQHV